MARRKETENFRRFSYIDIMARDKANLDIQWTPEAVDTARDETPRRLMREILSDLEEAMREFAVAEAETQR